MMFELVASQLQIRSLTGPSERHVAPPSSERPMYASDCDPHDATGESLKSNQHAYTVPAEVTAISGSQSSNHGDSLTFMRDGVDQAVPLGDDAMNTSRWS